MSRSSVRLVLALSVTAASAVAAGTVWANVTNDRLQGAEPANPTVYTSGRREVGVSTSQGAALDASLAGLDRSLIKSVSLGAQPKDLPGHGTWFYATVQDGGPLPVGLWEADLAQGATAERLADGADNLGTVITGSSIRASDGASLGGGAGDIRSGQRFRGSGETDEALTDHINNVVQSFGLAVAEVRILHPMDPAAYIRIDVHDPDQVHGQFPQLASALIGSPGGAVFEGVYLEIASKADGPLAISSTAFRSGAGRAWFNEAYASQLGTVPMSAMAPDLSDEATTGR